MQPSLVVQLLFNNWCPNRKVDIICGFNIHSLMNHEMFVVKSSTYIYIYIIYHYMPYCIVKCNNSNYLQVAMLWLNWPREVVVCGACQLRRI